MTLDADNAAAYVGAAWDGHILDALCDYIRIPNVSPAYDSEWAENGHMGRAVQLIREWCDQRVASGLPEATVELHELPGRTPLLLIDVPAAGDGVRGDAAGKGAGIGTGGGSADGHQGDEDLVLLYGHLDKQPPFEGWRADLGPWEPVVEGDRLYGRGGADDGYAVFAALTAIEVVRASNGSHCRCVVLIEASEESGSPDLPAYLEALGDRLGKPSLVIGLDSGCGDWDHLWVTTSLRGLIDLVLRVDVLTEGVHSGKAGGIVPSSFRILRMLLDRIEDPETGTPAVPELRVEVPPHRRAQVKETAAEFGAELLPFPFVPGAHAGQESAEDLILAGTWGSALEVVGLEGAPEPGVASNTLRPFTAAKLSIRVPPTADPQAAAATIVKRLQGASPYGASVTVTPGMAEPGWHAPVEPPWLTEALAKASVSAFGRPPRAMGEGGTIPFMGMLGRSFPDAAFVVTGVLGPESNAHGPNEFLQLPTARRLTTAVAHLLDAHAKKPNA